MLTDPKISQDAYEIIKLGGTAIGTALAMIGVFFLNKLKDDAFDLVLKIYAWITGKPFTPRDKRKKAPSGGAPDDNDCVKMAVFKEHKEGDGKTLSVILAGLDQNSRVIQAAAIDTTNNAKQMQETANLIALSQKEQRMDFDNKIGDIHEKINETNNTVAMLSGQVGIVIELAKRSIK